MMKEEYPLKYEVKMKITFATNLEGDLMEWPDTHLQYTA